MDHCREIHCYICCDLRPICITTIAVCNNLCNDNAEKSLRSLSLVYFSFREQSYRSWLLVTMSNSAHFIVYYMALAALLFLRRDKFNSMWIWSLSFARRQNWTRQNRQKRKTCRWTDIYIKNKKHLKDRKDILIAQTIHHNFIKNLRHNCASVLKSTWTKTVL